MADDDHEEHEHVHGFALPIPADLISGMQRDRQRAAMMADEKLASIYRFLDSLDVEQLLALRTILNVPAENAYGLNQYHDGQVVTLLRLVHKVDPDTGEDPAKALLESEGAPE